METIKDLLDEIAQSDVLEEKEKGYIKSIAQAAYSMGRLSKAREDVDAIAYGTPEGNKET